MGSYSGNKVFEKENYIIIKVGNGFIIYNTNKEFKEGHTHLNSFGIAKTLIDCAIHNKLPKTRNQYLLESLIRISDNSEFSSVVRELIDTRNNKGRKKTKRK